MTQQYLKKRIQQHQYGANKLRKLNKVEKDKHSALSVHLYNLNHHINLDNVRILERESNYRKRRILEMINIKTTYDTINKQTDTEYLQSSYKNILFKKTHH